MEIFKTIYILSSVCSQNWEQLSGFAWESEAAHWLGDMIGLNSGARPWRA